jgi:hypothetical protein
VIAQPILQPVFGKRSGCRDGGHGLQWSVACTLLPSSAGYGLGVVR